MNKKYSLIFLLSFITYFFILIARPYISARWSADLVLLIFIIAIIYQIIYIFYLRKYSNVSLKYAISLYFLYLCFVLEIYIVYYYLYIFISNFIVINGGFAEKIKNCLDLIKNNGWANLVNLPILVICGFYQIIFFIIKRKIKIKDAK